MACADDLESAVNRIGAEHIAGFIAEPIIGAAGGAVVPPEGYYQKIKKICERNEILFIADEVMTGIARTGAMFGMEHWGTQPDLIALGKGMSAGYTPIAAVMVKDHVMEPILQGSKLVMAGHTYSANPQSAAVSLAVLNYIDKHDLAKAAEVKGSDLLSRLKGLSARYDIIGDVRGKGLLLAVEFVSDRAGKLPFSTAETVTARIVNKAFDKGLLIYPAAGGLDGTGDAVIIAPPLVITQDEIDLLVHTFEETVREVMVEVMG